MCHRNSVIPTCVTVIPVIPVIPRNSAIPLLESASRTICLGTERARLRLHVLAEPWAVILPEICG
jgi:hypothetical protein